MARLKINIFYLISSICSLLLVGYAWFVFLPPFNDTPVYSAVQYVVILLTVLLIAVSGIQIFLSIRREETQEDDSATELK